MSIANSIVALERKGELTRYVPARTLRAPARRFFMTKHMAQLLTDPNSAVNLLVGRGAIEAALTQWTVGDYLYDNGHGGPGFIKRLVAPPPEIWEIRVTHPAPQARIFGRFAEPDTFIATTMHTRSYLGSKGSGAWISTCNQCAADWAALLPMFPPHQGKAVCDYITEDCDDFPLP
jgi:hypothetical protein